MVTFSDIEMARHNFGAAIKETPCRRADYLSQTVGADCYLKFENLQYTGSFKSRGALNRLLQLTDEERKRGVIAASAGNHAQGVAHHAARLGVPATIVMPVGTPLIKVTRTAEFGASVVLDGDNYDAAYERAVAAAEETGAVLIHAYDDDAVIAGQGTVGLEVIEQHPRAEVILVPVGGGGLAAGVAIAAKKIKPTVRIVGVEPAAIPSMQRAIEAGGPFTLDKAKTIADGIAVRNVGQRCYDICKDMVDEWVTVTDDEIAHAILYLLEKEKTVAEGAGAAGVAALLAGKVADIEGRHAVALLCGGNIDVNVISRVIERGLVETGRLARLNVTMGDYPGALAELLNHAASVRANVAEVHHERAFSPGTLGEVLVALQVETRGHDHVEKLVSLLEQKGYAVKRV